MGLKIIIGLMAVFLGLVGLCAVIALNIEEPVSPSASSLADELGCDFIAAEYRAVAPLIGHQAGVQSVQQSANLKLGVNQHVFYGEAEAAVNECVTEQGD